MTLTDVDSESGGLCVLPGSHKLHSDVCARVTCARFLANFLPIDMRDPIMKIPPILVAAKAGDLLLWDSRTIHCNTPALQSPTIDPSHELDIPRLLRVACYVCMGPARFATKEVIAQRIQGFENNESTSHWPHEYHRAGVALPGTPLKCFEKAPKMQQDLIRGSKNKQRPWETLVQGLRNWWMGG